MRKAIPTALAVLFSACASGQQENQPPEGAGTPTDMIFRATVTPVQNTCDAVSPTAASIFVDVLSRNDGTVDVLFKDGAGVVPGPSMVTEVSRQADQVEPARVDTWTSPNSHREYTRTLSGTINPDLLELEVIAEDEREANGSYAACVRRVKISGVPRGILDPASLDGKFRLALRKQGWACGSDPAPEPGDPWNIGADVDLSPTGDTAVDLDGVLRFSPNIAEVNSAAGWSGEMEFLDVFGVEKLKGSLTGTFRPDRVDVILRYAPVSETAGAGSQSGDPSTRPLDTALGRQGEDKGPQFLGSAELHKMRQILADKLSVRGFDRPDRSVLRGARPNGADDCFLQYQLQGAKSVPSKSRADNDYRVTVTGYDGCNPRWLSMVGPAELIPQKDGSQNLVELKEFGYRGVAIPLTGDSFTLMQESFFTDETLSYEGRVSPPLLQYQVDYSGPAPNGGRCQLKYEAVGHVRFLF